jgi:hypothetical protein
VKEMISERLRAHPNERGEKLINSTTWDQAKIAGNFPMILLRFGINVIFSGAPSELRGQNDVTIWHFVEAGLVGSIAGCWGLSGYP